jgi:hypothetical protein
MATGTIILPVQSAKLPSANPARINGVQTSWALLFDASTSQSGWWQFRMPQNYASTPVLKIQYTPGTTQSGTLAAVWRAYIEGVATASDIFTDSYGTANSATSTMSNNQAAGILTEVSIPLSNVGGTLAGGNFIKIKIDRDAANGSDTATGDMYVVNVSLEYTTT